MAQRSGGARFALEALGHALTGHEMRAHHLDRDFAVERDIMCQVYGRHAAAAEEAHDLILAECDLAQCVDQPGVAFREQRRCTVELARRNRGLLAGGVGAAARTKANSRLVGSPEW